MNDIIALKWWANNQPVGGLRFANAVGALTTTRRGAIPALPMREQVLEIFG